jgi:predicted RNase H-like HicB family nuclease
MMMSRYLIVVEKAEKNYSAYAPDLPGCVATGNTREEAEANMRDAIEMHVNGLIEDHASIPEP